MSVVIDSNLLIVLVTGDPRGKQVSTQFTNWIELNIPLHAPDLVPYAVANTLTRAIVALDGPLYQNAVNRGFSVQLLGEA